MGRGAVRLFCLPFAGGNSHAYRDWAKHLGADIEVDAVELPGRGRRSGEPLLLSMDALVDDALQQMRPRLEAPYAIYGHSMGACLAYLLTHAIGDADLPVPLHLFCSGRNAPSVTGEDRGRHLLPRDDFIRELREMGGCPDAILNDHDLMDYFLPILRADFQAHASYAYQPRPPLGVALTAMMGTEDRETERAAVVEWQRETQHALDLVEYPGGHFFINDHLPAIARHISAKL
tara:strand:- start:246 stop:944 length:699 start_codon:yes stop_codon:yes gene_type:complete